MSVSRIVPPPIPVAVPSRAKPTKSICLREATSAPVVAKTTIPNQSSSAAKVSNISHFHQPSGATWARHVSSTASPRQDVQTHKLVLHRVPATSTYDNEPKDAPVI